MVRHAKKIHFLFFTIIEHGMTRGLDALMTLILVMSLSTASLGSFVVYQSWVAILLLGFPALENVLYRDYAKIKAAGALAEQIGIFKAFNFIKVFAAAILTIGLAMVPLAGLTFSERFFAMALAFVLPLAPSLYGIYREPLRFELKQSWIAWVTAFQKIAFISAIYFLSKTQAGAIQPIAVAILVLAFGFGYVWSAVAKKQLGIDGGAAVGMSGVQRALPGIRKSLLGTVIWLHVNGALTAAVQTLDVYFLSHHKLDLREIALYSLALKAANFFQIVIIPFSQVLGVFFASKIDYRNRIQVRGALLLGTGLFLALAAGVFGFGHLLSVPILEFLARGKFSADEILRGADYFQWLLAGICVLSLCYVQGIYLNNRGKLKTMTVFIFAPWFLISAVGYYWAGAQGALTAAKFNVPIYALCTLGLHVYAWLVYKRDRSTV